MPDYTGRIKMADIPMMVSSVGMSAIHFQGAYCFPYFCGVTPLIRLNTVEK